MKKMFIGIVLGIAITLALVSAWMSGTGRHEISTVQPLRTSALPAEYFTCPMHPSVHSDKPGVCPICGMTLVKKSSHTGEPAGGRGAVEAISLTSGQRVVANVATTRAERKSIQLEIHAVGKIDYAEPNFRHISMRYPGRIEKLYLSFTGSHVSKGDRVAEVYSPEAISAQQEYLLAKESYEQVKESPELISGGALELLQQSRHKLSLWGFTDRQIEVLDSTKLVSDLVTIYSPISGIVLKKNAEPQRYVNTGEDIYDIADLSTVWMYADIYEQDLQSLKTTQRVRMTIDAYPGEIFTGSVIFIDPVIDPETRTVRIRSEFSNNGGKLKPEMYVKAAILIAARESIVVPTSAILSTGKRNIVWVEVSENTFEPREVTVGSGTDGHSQILAGLNDGDIVVSSGGYLLESESQLQHAPDSLQQTH